MSVEQFPIRENQSSNVKWARYDPVESRLEIDFKDKDGNYASTYEYGSAKVPFTRQDWEDFRAANRPGEHFAFRIRGKFPYRKVVKTAKPVERPAEQEKLF